MSRNTLKIVMFALGTLAVGCGSSASLTRKDTLGGRVALHGAYMPSMADARLLMVEHCQGQVDMVEVDAGVEFRCRAQATAGAEPKQLAALRRDSAL